jgi:putative membrane protein
MDSSSPSLTYYIVQWIVSAAALLLTAKVMPGFRIKGFGSALVAAVVIGLANILIWPILIFLTLPINILTLGLFTFVVNGAILKLCAAILKGFEITNWFSAILGAIVLSIVNWLLRLLLNGI